MKSPLRFFLVVTAFILLSGYSYAQSTAEPTIDSTLDNMQNLSAVEGSNSKQYTVIVKGNNKVGQQVKIRMKLANPADSAKFSILRLVKNVPTVPITFDAQGVGILNANDWYTLQEDDVNAAVLEITFNAPGTIKYELDLLRNDGNVIAKVSETIRVASVAGIDDMIENTQVKVYPVPASRNDEVTLNLGELRNASVTVVDLLGKPVYQAEKLSGVTKINTSGFSKGMYFIKVIKGSEAAMVRMLVQ